MRLLLGAGVAARWDDAFRVVFTITKSSDTSFGCSSLINAISRTRRAMSWVILRAKIEDEKFPRCHGYCAVKSW